MVILGGLEIVAAGYLINRHQKNKAEARRLQEEEDRLDEESYRIHSATNAGPRPRRHSHSQDHGRRHSQSRDRRHRSHSHSRDDRKDDGKYGYGHGHESSMNRPHKGDPRPQTHSAPPPVYAAAPPAMMGPPRPPQAQDPSYPPTGWPAHWAQSQQPQGPVASGSMPPNLAPYYRDPGVADVKYGFRDEREGERERGRDMLSPEDAERGTGGGNRRRAGSGSASGSMGRRGVRFDVPGRTQPGDEAPPAYRP